MAPTEAAASEKRTVAMMGFVEAVLFSSKGGGVLKVPRGENGNFDGVAVLKRR